MTLFKGYAETKGFRPVKVPDISSKIRQQGLHKMRGMEAALAANTRQDEWMIRKLEENAKIEAENFDSNFELKMNYRDVLANAEWKNRERAIKNSETRRHNKERQIKSLLSMVPSGLKLVQAMDAHRKEGIENLAKDVYYKYGVGTKRAGLIKTHKDNLFAESMHKEGFMSTAGRDIPEEIQSRIRRSGGYFTIKLAELEAYDLGARMGRVYFDRWNEKFDIAGQMVDLESANPEVQDQIMHRILLDEQDKLGDQWPSTNIWNSSGAHELNQRAMADVRRVKQERSRKLALEERYDDEISTIKHLIQQNDGRGIWSGPIGIHQAILFKAGGANASREALSAARTEIVSATVHALKNGMLNWEDVKGLERLPITPRGSTKEVFWGDYFDKEWRQIEIAGSDASTIENELAMHGPRARKTSDLIMREKMIELDLEEDQGVKTWAKFAGIAKKNGYEKTHQWIVDKIASGQNSDMDVENGIILQERFSRHEIVTDEEIDRMQFSDTARTQAKIAARKHNKFYPQPGKNGTSERLKERIKEELEGLIPRTNSWSWNASHTDAALEAYSQAAGHYRTHFEKHGNEQDAYEYARDMIAKKIRDPDSEFAPGEINSNGLREHKGFQADTNRNIIKGDNPVQLKAELTNDPTNIYTKPYIEEADIRNKVGRLHKGLYTGVLPRTTLLHSITGMPTIDILLGQREYWANKEIAEKGSTTIPEIPKEYIDQARKAESLMHPGPQAQILLSYYSPSYVNQASVKSGNNPIYQKPQFDKVRPVALQASGGDYNSIGPGINSKESRGYRLVNITIRDILEIMEAGNIEIAGGYHLNGDQINKAVEESGLSYERLFNSETQDILFNTLFKLGGYNLPDVEEEYEALLINSVSSSINEQKTDTSLGWHAKHLLSRKASKYLYFYEQGEEINATA